MRRLTPQSAHVLFPVDGFRGQTDAAVLAAAESLMDHLATLGAADLALYRVDAGKSIANSTRSAVVTFTEARREDQYSFFHSLSGHRNAHWESRLTR